MTSATEKYFIHNLETNKLNIFSSKDVYVSLPPEKRDVIKRYCLFSRQQGCWISKGYADGAIYLRQVLIELGFEDRGRTGEALGIEERIERKQERAQVRADRLENCSEKASTESERLYRYAHDMASAIPFGQPILVGHHSEKRDRRYRERIHNTFARAFETSKKAGDYAQRAAIARATAAGAQYSDPAYLGNRIRECEAEIRLIERRLQGKLYDDSDPRPISETYRLRLVDSLTKQQDELAFYRHCLDTCGQVLFNRETLKGKTAVLIRGKWQEIVKLNPTTVSVPNICYSSLDAQRRYALKYAYTEVRDAR